jgi:hypothetical protein
LLLLFPAAKAQQPPPPAAQPVVLEYSGKPLVIPFHCSEDDIQWAGLTCPADGPCPIYLELSSIEVVGAEHIFIAGNLHSPAVTLYSTMLASDDGGRIWRETAPRVRGAVLERIEFLDSNTGWVSGHSVSPLPQDPFLLSTTDGGMTWRTRAVFPESAEERLGLIQQFSFTAKDNGSLIIDRGQGSDDDRWELYESPDGGASWSIRQTSATPLRLKRTASPNPDWRLRADARTKAFEVEHRQGEHWSSVAAFSVGAGTCVQER